MKNVEVLFLLIYTFYFCIFLDMIHIFLFLMDVTSSIIIYKAIQCDMFLLIEYTAYIFNTLTL